VYPCLHPIATEEGCPLGALGCRLRDSEKQGVDKENQGVDGENLGVEKRVKKLKRKLNTAQAKCMVW